MSTLSSFLLGSQNPQQVTSSSSTSQALPTWLTQYSQGLLGSASSLVPQTTSNLGNAQSPLSAAQPLLGSAQSTLGSALSAPSGAAVAQPSVNQATGIVNNAINPANSGSAAAAPYLSEANQTFNNPNTVSSYMSPYLNDVTAYNTQLSNQNLEQQVLPAVASQSIANGDFAGSPMGTAEGWQINQAEQNLQAQNLAAANQGYTEAGTLFDTDAARQGTLGQLAGTLGTQQQGAELQGASTLGSLGTSLGQLQNTSTGLGIQGGSALGALGSTAGQLAGTGNSEQLSQLGLLGSLTGTPGGTTTTTNASNPNPYSEMQTAGAGSSTLANALATLTGSSSGTGALGSLASLLGGTNTQAGYDSLGSYLTNQGSNIGSTNTDIGNYVTGNPLSNITTGDVNFPTYYASGGHVGSRGMKPSDHWHTPKRFMAADGGAVRKYASGGTQLPSYAQDLNLSVNPNAVYVPTDQSAYYSGSQPTATQQSVPMPMLATGTAAGTPLSSLTSALLGSSGTTSAPSGTTSAPSGGNPITADLGAANTIANAASKAITGSPLTGAVGDVSQGLGAGLAGLGIYNAIQNPKSPASDAQGAYDAYKLYNTGSNLASSLSSGAGAGLSDSAVAAGVPGVDTGALNGAIDSAYDSIDLGADAGADVAADAGADAAGAGAASSSLGSLATGAGVLAVPLALALSGALAPNVPTTFNDKGALAQGMSIGKLPSGNSLLENQDVGIGGGTQTAQGSNQIYDLAGGKQTLLPTADTTALTSDVLGLINPQTLAAQYTEGAYNPGGGTGSIAQQANIAKAGAPTAAELAQQTATDQAGIDSIYNQTGGAKAWGGATAAQIQQQLENLFKNVNFGKVAS